ncbi:MAG: 3-methyl-2-oxobutanoate dehydrogenase subunit VorB, partial [Candidatus Firestonebacteria bacterium]
ARAMTSSSSPGISLKQEAISYMAGMELPAVIVNIQRGGPGLGNIQGSQADYFQSVKGGGHGDYRLIVLSPSSIQEAVDLTMEAFDLAELYRNPVLILSDGNIGQMMEPALFKDVSKVKLPPRDWVLDGCKGRKPRQLFSLLMTPGALEKHNIHLQEKYKVIEKELVRWENYLVEDAEILIVANGIIGRISEGAAKLAREQGVRCGVLRPITLWPFPYEAIKRAAEKTRKILVTEQNLGQMVEDVRLAVSDDKKVSFYGRPGGGCQTSDEIFKKVMELSKR